MWQGAIYIKEIVRPKYGLKDNTALPPDGQKSVEIAAAFAIDLGFRIECNPELQKKFCDYISLASANHSLSIFEFYSHIGVDTSSTFYTDITNSVNRWLSSLIYTWRKQ